MTPDKNYDIIIMQSLIMMTIWQIQQHFMYVPTILNQNPLYYWKQILLKSYSIFVYFTNAYSNSDKNK